jgi:hypothetical protein
MDCSFFLKFLKKTRLNTFKAISAPPLMIATKPLRLSQRKKLPLWKLGARHMPQKNLKKRKNS